MKYPAFSVYDTAAEAYLTPFFLPQPAMAERVFRQMVNDPTHQFSQAPSDYTLFCVGEWDDQEGLIQGAVPQSIINGVQCKEHNIDA